MKLEAIAGRGSRKDFVDLFLLCQHMPLEEVFVAFEAKYGTGLTDRYHRLRALDYFEDAEAEPMPDMVTPISWDLVREFFSRQAQRLLAAGLVE